MGLKVHPYTFRAEDKFLPSQLRTRPDGAAEELALYLALGIDGFFTDHPDVGLATREAHVSSRASRVDWSRGNKVNNPRSMRRHDQRRHVPSSGK